MALYLLNNADKDLNFSMKLMPLANRLLEEGRIQHAKDLANIMAALADHAKQQTEFIQMELSFGGDK